MYFYLVTFTVHGKECSLVVTANDRAGACAKALAEYPDAYNIGAVYAEREVH